MCHVPGSGSGNRRQTFRDKCCYDCVPADTRGLSRDNVTGADFTAFIVPWEAVRKDNAGEIARDTLTTHQAGIFQRNTRAPPLRQVRRKVDKMSDEPRAST